MQPCTQPPQQPSGSQQKQKSAEETLAHYQRQAAIARAYKQGRRISSR